MIKLRNSLTIGIFLTLVQSPYIQAAPSLSALQASKTENRPHPQEGREYVTLTNPVASQPAVIEFFSFYCGPCYQFIEKYPVSAAINRLLPSNKVTKYHVGVMGPLGNELTEAWAVAIVTGKTEQVEIPLFEAVRNKKMNDITDIKSIFSQAGIDASTYDQVRKSLLAKSTVALQNTAVKNFSVTGTPSFYVNGQYKINNSGISAPSPQTYADTFSGVVYTLLQK